MTWEEFWAAYVRPVEEDWGAEVRDRRATARDHMEG